MTRSRIAVLTALCLAVPCQALGALASQPGQPAAQDPGTNVVVYDLGDLILAPTGPDELGRFTFAPIITPSSRGGAVDRLADGLARLLNLRHAALSPEVHAVEGSTAQQQAFEEALEQLRALHATRYQVDVSLLDFPAAEAPSIGDTADLGPRTTRHSIRGRVPAELSATRTVSYVSRWMPIVSDQSVGYDSQISEVTDGLRAQLSVGEGGPGGVAITLEGDLTLARVIDRREPLVESRADPLGGGLTIGLPEVHRRSLNAAMTVPTDRPVVICVVEGFKPDTAIAVVLRVRQAQ